MSKEAPPTELEPLIPPSNTHKAKDSPREITNRINPSKTRLRFITFSFPLLILLAIPFWWFTTSIERLPLPEAHIEVLSSQAPPTVRSTILLTADVGSYPPPKADLPSYTSKDVCEGIGDVVMDGVDSIYAQKRTKGVRYWNMVYEVVDRKQPPALHVHIKTSDRANTSFPLEPYIQSEELALDDGIKPGTVIIPVHPSQVSDRFLRQHYKIAIINSILALYPSTPPEIPLRALKYSPNVTLSIVLLNEDSTTGSYVRSWDIEGAIRDHFMPHLKPLSPIFNFTIESQILYHAPLSFEPTYGPIPSGEHHTASIDAQNAIDKAAQGQSEEIAKQVVDESKLENAWLIDEEMMKIFVNSERWSLDSGSTNNPVLRFLLFVPSERHRPMRLSTPDSAQSFLLPQFGAVALLNPPPPSLSSGPTDPSESYHLPTNTLAAPFHLFTSHLYSLLALPPYLYDKLHQPPSPNPLAPPNPLMPGMSRFQIETVLRQRMVENHEEARKTLVGIVRLVGKIKEMKVGKGVKDMVLGAVERLEQMKDVKDPLQAFLLSRDAVLLANQAFFDPSMMGLLYFPNEHKFAVYTPLFAPVAVPMIAALLKELISWRNRRKRKAQGKGEEEEPDEVIEQAEAVPRDHDSQNGQNESRVNGSGKEGSLSVEEPVMMDDLVGGGSRPSTRSSSRLRHRNRETSE